MADRPRSRRLTRGRRRVRRGGAVVALALACAVPAACTGGAGSGGGDSGAGDAGAARPAASATPSRAGSPAGPVPVDVSAAAAPGLTALEERYAARLGVWAVDTGSGRQVAHRADERFGYASTIKALLAGVLLAAEPAVDLDAVHPVTAADLVPPSPVAEGRVGTGMTLREAVAAAVGRSDNTAANLLLDAVGGPEGLAAGLRALGDTTTTPARREPDLNDVVPGDDRDTSTPRALATGLRTLVLTDALPADRRALLVDALRGSATGTGLVRAAVPADWAVAGKSGSGSSGARHDIAVVWPPGRDPVVLAVLSDHADPAAERDDALVAEAAGVVLDALA